MSTIPAPVFLAVVMERRSVGTRWRQDQWTAVAVEVDQNEARMPRILDEDATSARWLHTGLELRLYPDEAEGYFLNTSTQRPVLFVAWRLEDDIAMPWLVTASYNEASRLLDSGENVDSVPMPDALMEKVSAFVAAHYKPEPKRRARPPSFRGAHRDE